MPRPPKSGDPLSPDEFRRLIAVVEELVVVGRAVCDRLDRLQVGPAPGGVQPLQPGQAVASALAGLFYPPPSA